jgi:hypothetical protein
MIALCNPVWQIEYLLSSRGIIFQRLLQEKAGKALPSRMPRGGEGDRVLSQANLAYVPSTG